MSSTADGSVLRLIDANLNRAREGLRVLEDYARFVRDDASLCASLKALRHDLHEATRFIAEKAIAYRDAAGDVGTRISTSTEFERDDLDHVVIAAGKRLGEALRSIEEYLKTIDPAAARAVEAIRYRFYDLEKAIVATFVAAAVSAVSASSGGRDGRRYSAADRSRRLAKFAAARLYVLITESVCRRPWREAARLALEGGADVLQLREKSLDAGELLCRAKELVAMSRAFGALVIVNDRPDVAVLSDADGVHLGQGDLPAGEARKIVGEDRLIGVSTHCLDDAHTAVVAGADYLGVGPVYPSATKPREIAPGLPYLRHAAAEIRVPLVAIAGITEANVGEVVAAGAKCIAVTAAVVAADDPREAARRLKTAMSERRSTDSLSP